MKNKKILKHYSAKKIEEAIKICDNLFYGKYLETGELKTRAELQQHIKDEVTETFVQFWGADYAHELTRKIAAARIHFVYQIDGPSNSVDEFLVSLKTRRFNERYNTKFESPVLFKHVAKFLSKPFSNPVKKLQSSLTADDVPYNLVKCLEDLNVDQKKVIEDKDFAESIVERIKVLGKYFTKITYSDNPEIQKNIMSLENLIYKVEKQLNKECKRRHVELYDALFVNDLGIELDPLVAGLDLDKLGKLMLRKNEFAGLKADESSDIYFCIKPSDETLLHEFVHEVDNIAFEKDHKNWVTAIYTDQIRQNQMFNEVITDYFAMLMKKQREYNGKPSIISDGKDESEYSYLFGKMGKFLNNYLPELKEIRLREYPAEEFARIIGQENFNMIAMLSNELIALKNDLHMCKDAHDTETTLNDLITPESGYYFYGSLDYFAGEMEKLEKCCNQKMDKCLKDALRKQSLAKKIDLFLRDKSFELAEHFEHSKHPKLTKLAQKFVQAGIVYNNKAKQQAIKKLKEPLQNIGLKQPLLLEDKTGQNVDDLQQ